jgi:hypothetical protein
VFGLGFQHATGRRDFHPPYFRKEMLVAVSVEHNEVIQSEGLVLNRVRKNRGGVAFSIGNPDRVSLFLDDVVPCRKAFPASNANGMVTFNPRVDVKAKISQRRSHKCCSRQQTLCHLI